MKALPNNELPPTHFIELVSWQRGGEVKNFEITEIESLRYDLELTEKLSGFTIAIFKIRLK